MCSLSLTNESMKLCTNPDYQAMAQDKALYHKCCILHGSVKSSLSPAAW
jgi:hypothetical protein